LTERFEEVVEQIRVANIAVEVIKKVNFKDLQQKLLRILCFYNASYEMLDGALNLWSTSLIEN